MATKTDRILSYLPSTFRSDSRNSALFAVVDAFGKELLSAENSLAAIMSAHWVDHADRGAELIGDLARIGALYGLAPRPDESVDEFREHLKRYVRTFLEGTATVQGILRVTAEALGLRIADSYDELDSWWKRDRNELVTIVAQGNDAAEMIFGIKAITVNGHPATSAQVIGNRELNSGVDLRDTFILSIKIDDSDPVDINLITDVENPASVSIDEIIERINSVPGEIASHTDGKFLKLVPPSSGPDSRIEIHEVDNDAVQKILGLVPSTYSGSNAKAAQVTGTVDLSNGVDLSQERYIRLSLDGSSLAEIDCAGSAPAQTTLDQIRDAINSALDGTDVASHDGHFLTLTSHTVGFESSVGFQPPASQDARAALFGPVDTFYLGQDAQPARFTGASDLSNGVDLSDRSKIRVSVNGGAGVTIDCAGVDPANTQLIEIVSSINIAFGEEVATHNGRFLILTSPISGENSKIILEAPPESDASEEVLGVSPRVYVGSPATKAQIIGAPDLSDGVNLWTLHKILLAVDGESPVEVDLRAGVSNIGNVTLEELNKAINVTVGSDIANHDGQHLIIKSPAVGSASSLIIEPMEIKRVSRFVTRAMVIDDAAQKIFGFVVSEARGEAGTNAFVVGKSDLSRGVDLREGRFLRLSIDKRAAVDIDCSGMRPRATLIEEVVTKINDKLGEWGLDMMSAIDEPDKQKKINKFKAEKSKRTVLIVDVDTGTSKVWTIAIFNDEGEFVNKELTDVGNNELAIELNKEENDKDRIIKLATSYLGLTQLGSTVAGHDGRYLVLNSSITGADSRIVFEPPRAQDALDKLIGLEPGTFRGEEATQVRFTGTVNLNEGIDLPGNAAIKIGFDGADPVEISFDNTEPTQFSMTQIVIKINLGLNTPIASHDGTHLVITSKQSGEASKIEFDVPGGVDVTKKIFGFNPPRLYQGKDAKPAQIVGKMDLSSCTDLKVARFILLEMDGGSPVDVDCAAKADNLSNVSLEEIKEAINEALGLEVASHNDINLILESPTTGLSSRIKLEIHTSGDARQLLFGGVPDTSEGTDPSPAIISGEVDLLSSVDLSQRKFIRVVVNRGRPIDIDVSGTTTNMTFLDEIIEAINIISPGFASVTDDRLQLTSPTAGEESHLSIEPLRTLDLVEYPPQLLKMPPRSVRHGDRWNIKNSGSADTYAEILLSAPQGVVWPSLVNRSVGWQIRVLAVINAGEKVSLWLDEEQELRSVIRNKEGKERPLNESDIIVGPFGSQARVPFEGVWYLTIDANNVRALQLNNPLASNIVILRAKQTSGNDTGISLKVVESDPGDISSQAITKGGNSTDLIGRVRMFDGIFHLIDADDVVVVQLRGGKGVELEAFKDKVVRVKGLLNVDAPLLFIVNCIAQVFNVTIYTEPKQEEDFDEFYPAVTIGIDTKSSDSLVWQINTGPSLLVKAEELNKGTVLTLPRGRTEWLYLDCLAARFNQARFDVDKFSGGVCIEPGLFDVSRFDNVPPESLAAVFATSDKLPDATVDMDFRWTQHQAGAIQVNLPADLPERFGGRFNDARFGCKEDSTELYEDSVTEPVEDLKYIVTLLNHPNNGSSLVVAEVVPFVPLGWAAIAMPFRKPQFLTLGDDKNVARVYLSEEGLDGFVEIRAKEKGKVGNKISVAARKSGPAMFDVTINFEGGRFESAREVVLGDPLPVFASEIIKPGRIGVLQAKAAGIEVSVTRNGVKAIQ